MIQLMMSPIIYSAISGKQLSSLSWHYSQATSLSLRAVGQVGGYQQVRLIAEFIYKFQLLGHFCTFCRYEQSMNHNPHLPIK